MTTDAKQEEMLAAFQQAKQEMGKGVGAKAPRRAPQSMVAVEEGEICVPVRNFLDDLRNAVAEKRVLFSRSELESLNRLLRLSYLRI